MSTRTKIILRIIVTLAILGLTVLGVWLIWFKPTNELEIFQNLTNLQNSNEKSFITARSAVESRNYLNDNTDKYLVGDLRSTDSQQKIQGQIAYYRLYMFGGFVDAGQNSPYVLNRTDDSQTNKYTTITSITNLNPYLGLNKMYEAVDGAFDYYYSYVQLAENVENDDVKKINGLINTVKNNYSGFIALQENELSNLLANVTNENRPTVLNQVCAIYENLYTQYFKVVESYADLTLGVKDFVVKYVFDGTLTFDEQIVYNDVALNAIAEWAEASKANNAANIANYKIFVKGTNGVEFNDNSVYIVYSADVANVLYASNYAKNNLNSSAAFVNEIPAVIESYAKLASKYSAPLNGNLSIFKLTNAKKHTLFNLTTELDPETNQQVNVLNELQSEYNETYLNNVRLVLNHFFRLSTEEVSA